MALRFSHNSGFTKFIIIVEFLLVAYLLYSLTKNVFNSYQVDKYIEAFEKENQTIEEENKRKNEDYLYFTSEQYIDKIAKQNLGLINAGEEVIILSPDILDKNLPKENGNADTEYDSAHAKVSNPIHWLNFFLGKN